MHRTTRHVRPRLIAGALATLILLPVVATAIVQRTAGGPDARLKNEAIRIARMARRLSTEKKEGLTSAASGRAEFQVPTGTAQGIFTTNAATDQESILGYFAGQKLATVRIGLPFLKPAFLAKELRIVGILFPDTPTAKVAEDTAVKIESEKFDEGDVNKSLDLLISSIGRQYEKKGEAASFNFQAGSTTGMATVLGVLYGVEDFDMQKQVKSTFGKLMENAKATAKLPTGDLQDELKKSFVVFSEAKITDQDSAFAAIKPVDDAYKAALD